MSRVLSALLAMLVMVAPFSVDTCLPGFAAMAHALHAEPAQMQQTLSSFLIGFAVMALFHGTLSDSLGRRPVVLATLLGYVIGSVGCALSVDVVTLVAFRLLQGMTAGAGWVISAAVVHDTCSPESARKALSRITLIVGIAPVTAPLVGGLLLVHLGWQSIFWFMALLGAALLFVCWRWLPETLARPSRQPLAWRDLFKGYAELITHRRLVLVALANDLPFNGFFIFVACAPAFLGEHLHLAPTDFFVFFLALIVGVMAGSWASGFMASRMSANTQIGWGLSIMLGAALALCLHTQMGVVELHWALPLIGLYASGWAMMNPAISLIGLALVPHRKGMAASLVTFILSLSNAVVAGPVATRVMSSPSHMAVVALLSVGAGLVAWCLVRPTLVRDALGHLNGAMLPREGHSPGA